MRITAILIYMFKNKACVQPNVLFLTDADKKLVKFQHLDYKLEIHIQPERLYVSIHNGVSNKNLQQLYLMVEY